MAPQDKILNSYNFNLYEILKTHKGATQNAVAVTQWLHSGECEHKSSLISQEMRFRNPAR